MVTEAWYRMQQQQRKKLLTVRQSTTVIALVALLMSVTQSPATVAADPALRPMRIHQLPGLGLEIWTELEPLWISEVVRYRSREVFTVQTPPLSYPPAAMTYTGFPTMQVKRHALPALATQVLVQGAVNYAVPDKVAKHLPINPASYGPLQGFEMRFQGIADGQAVDVRLFLGNAEHHPPVLLQAYTLAGHGESINEHIRRSWNNVSYLPTDAPEQHPDQEVIQ